MGKAARLKRERRQTGQQQAPAPTAGELEAKQAAQLAAVRQERANACLAALELTNRATLAKHACRLHVVARVQMPGGEVLAIETPDFAYVVTPLERGAPKVVVEDRPKPPAAAG